MKYKTKRTNPWKGEVSLYIDGKIYVMRLTLGALAQCEATLKMTFTDMIMALERGTLSIQALIIILSCALEAGEGKKSHAITLEKTMIDGGILEAFTLVGRLFENAFYPETGQGSLYEKQANPLESLAKTRTTKEPKSKTVLADDPL